MFTTMSSEIKRRLKYCSQLLTALAFSDEARFRTPLITKYSTFEKLSKSCYFIVNIVKCIHWNAYTKSILKIFFFKRKKLFPIKPLLEISISGYYLFSLLLCGLLLSKKTATDKLSTREIKLGIHRGQRNRKQWHLLLLVIVPPFLYLCLRSKKEEVTEDDTDCFPFRYAGLLRQVILKTVLLWMDCQLLTSISCFIINRRPKISLLVILKLRASLFGSQVGYFSKR